MSSRSKEKVANALRKIFKGNRDKTDMKDENGNKDNEGGMENNVAANVMDPKNAALHVAGAPTDSPSKRKRRQDNKVSPATIPKVVNNTPHGPDFSIRARRLMKEFREMQKIQDSKKDPVFTVELINDNLFEWNCRLHVIDPDSKLARDMAELNIPHILLHLVFPQNFPFAPPFMRVVEPRIEKGFVMEGGAICMELLTPRGWASAYTVEAVIMQFAASVVKGQGRVMRKQRNSKEFSRRTAEDAFRSLVKTHEKYGWVTPSLSDG